MFTVLVVGITLMVGTVFGGLLWLRKTCTEVTVEQVQLTMIGHICDLCRGHKVPHECHCGYRWNAIEFPTGD